MYKAGFDPAVTFLPLRSMKKTARSAVARRRRWRRNPLSGTHSGFGRKRPRTFRVKRGEPQRERTDEWQRVTQVNHRHEQAPDRRNDGGNQRPQRLFTPVDYAKVQHHQQQIHGIKHRRGRGFIRVSGREENGRLVLTVADNGAGMTPERLRQVRESLNNDAPNEGEGGCYGLFNVNKRIQLYYNQPEGVEIQSDENGTTVSLSVPFGRKDDVQSISG